jgi:hypothetical protein
MLEHHWDEWTPHEALDTRLEDYRDEFDELKDKFVASLDESQREAIGAIESLAQVFANRSRILRTAFGLACSRSSLTVSHLR